MKVHLYLIRVHKIFENDAIEYHFQKVKATEWAKEEEKRLEVAETLAYSIPEPGTLLTMYVDTSFGFAQMYFQNDEEVAVEMAKHVLLCPRGCIHQKATKLAL